MQEHYPTRASPLGTDQFDFELNGAANGVNRNTVHINSFSCTSTALKLGLALRVECFNALAEVIR